MTAVIVVAPHRLDVQVDVMSALDADELVAMHERCSVQSRYQRWHGHVRTFPRAYLADLVAPGDDQLAVLARLDGTVVGFASAARVDESTRELGVLVEDGWQHRGIGRLLVSALVTQCLLDGATQLRAEVLADDAALLTPLRALGPARTTSSHGVLRLTVEIE